MRFLIVDNYHPDFIAQLYAQQPELARLPYQQQRAQILSKHFGTADYYSYNLKKLGHEAEELIINCAPLQEQWARENSSGWVPPQFKWRTVRGVNIPWFQTLDRQRQIALQQIRAYRPDVIYVQDCISFQPLLKAARRYARLLIVQHASALPKGITWDQYDLALTSILWMAAYFREQGTKSHYFKLAFEPRILNAIATPEQRLPVVFVGSLSIYHRERQQWLEQLIAETPLTIRGRVKANIGSDSPIWARYQGGAWGNEMYQYLHDARICLNKHIDLAQEYANNMRLYEATGVGTLLLTDQKKNLGEIFDVGREVVAYTDTNDCLEKIRYYLAHEDERQAIAAAGQQRTLNEHTYFHRMQELLEILKAYI